MRSHREKYSAGIQGLVGANVTRSSAVHDAGCGFLWFVPGILRIRLDRPRRDVGAKSCRNACELPARWSAEASQSGDCGRIDRVVTGTVPADGDIGKGREGKCR